VKIGKFESVKPRKQAPLLYAGTIVPGTFFRKKPDYMGKSSKKAAAKEFVKYHNDGTIWAKGQMNSDKPDGYWEWYRKDGVIMRSGYFENGKQIGEWTTYDKKGKIYKVTKMKG
jgi:antitoxin component YwqK of YwqJK toxin-antitoxin module